MTKKKPVNINRAPILGGKAEGPQEMSVQSPQNQQVPIDGNSEFIIKGDLLTEVINYLTTKPFFEVNPLLVKIQTQVTLKK